MSSYKDTFEPYTFAASTFACGAWRGNGVSTVVSTPSLFYRPLYDPSATPGRRAYQPETSVERRLSNPSVADTRRETPDDQVI